jgi:transcriptional regulator with XRE-family HTH domain
VQELDKVAMGRRIRQIRVGAGLRQWELARLLGTTQSAVHKYEHGVVPEPRRLIELARVGGTSIEWVLTGRHWENGSDSQERLAPEVLRVACTLREITAEERATVTEALGIIREAVRALEPRPDDGALSGQVSALSDVFRENATETLRLLESAWRIQQLVLKRVAQDSTRRMDQGVPFSGSSGKPPSSTGVTRTTG